MEVPKHNTKEHLAKKITYTISAIAGVNRKINKLRLRNGNAQKIEKLQIHGRKLVIKCMVFLFN